MIDAPSDLNEVEMLLAQYEISHEHVILMPQGTTALALKERSEWLVEACACCGYRFSARMHILIWGDERGR